MNSRFRTMIFVLFSVFSIAGMLASPVGAAVGTLDGGGRDPKILVGGNGGLVGPTRANISGCSVSASLPNSGPSFIRGKAVASCPVGSGYHTVAVYVDGPGGNDCSRSLLIMSYGSITCDAGRSTGYYYITAVVQSNGSKSTMALYYVV